MMNKLKLAALALLSVVVASTGHATAYTASSGLVMDYTGLALKADQFQTADGKELATIKKTESGTVTLNGTSAVTVTNSAYVTTDVVDFSLNAVGTSATTAGTPVIISNTAGSFIVSSTNSLNNNTYNYTITHRN